MSSEVMEAITKPSLYTFPMSTGLYQWPSPPSSWEERRSMKTSQHILQFQKDCEIKIQQRHHMPGSHVSASLVKYVESICKSNERSPMVYQMAIRNTMAKFQMYLEYNRMVFIDLWHLCQEYKWLRICKLISVTRRVNRMKLKGKVTSSSQ